MFRTHYITDDQSYLVVDYDHFSMTLGLLKFEKRKPVLIASVRSFFSPEDRIFQTRSFERNFLQSCEQLEKKVGTLPKEVCLFLDHGESVVTSTGYTFTRENIENPLQIEEIDTYAKQLREQSKQQSRRLWHDEYGYDESDRKLLSLFLSHLALDKRHHSFPLGKRASHITMRCLFFYGNKSLIEGVTRSLSSSDYTLIACVPLACVFLNHLCNQNTLLDNHLHIHMGYDSTTVILHLGKHVQEIQTLPFGWKILDEALSLSLSPLERESLLLGNGIKKLQTFPEWDGYFSFFSASLRILFERFGLQWSFNTLSYSGQGPVDILPSLIQTGELSPWIQKNSTFRRLGAHDDEHWLHYLRTLDPLFSLHPHPLLALVRSAFFSSYADS